MAKSNANDSLVIDQTSFVIFAGVWIDNSGNQIQLVPNGIAGEVFVTAVDEGPGFNGTTFPVSTVSTTITGSPSGNPTHFFDVFFDIWDSGNFNTITGPKSNETAVCTNGCISSGPKQGLDPLGQYTVGFDIAALNLHGVLQLTATGSAVASQVDNADLIDAAFASGVGDDPFSANLVNGNFTVQFNSLTLTSTLTQPGVPEPGTLLLLGSGLLFAGRRFRKMLS